MKFNTIKRQQFKGYMMFKKRLKFPSFVMTFSKWKKKNFTTYYYKQMFISIQNEKMNESINLLSLTQVYISFNGKKMMNVCLWTDCPCINMRLITPPLWLIIHFILNRLPHEKTTYRNWISILPFYTCIKNSRFILDSILK